MKSLALTNEAKCSACASLFFSICTGNIFGIICACNVRYKLDASKDLRVDAHGCLKVLYLLAQALFITIVAVQFLVVLLIVNGKYLGLIGVAIPLTLVGIGGIWSTHSAFTSYENTYLEESEVGFTYNYVGVKNYAQWYTSNI